MGEEEARERFATARVAVLATIDAKGRPHLVPIVFALDGECLYSAIDAKKKRPVRPRRLANLEMHAEVSVLVQHYEEDWGALWWARADGVGEAIELTDTRADQGIGLLRARYAQYGAVEITGPLLVIRPTRYTSWSATPKEAAS